MKYFATVLLKTFESTLFPFLRILLHNATRPPRINRLRAMQKGSDFTLKNKTAFFQPLRNLSILYAGLCGKSVFVFRCSPRVPIYCLPWFSLLITVLKPVKQALPPPEYPAQPHWGDGRLMRFECVRRCASFLAAGAVPSLAALHACGKFHCFARHTSRFALMQQPAAYNKAPANRREMAKKLEAVWMGEAIKHAAGGQLNAQLKKRRYNSSISMPFHSSGL